MEAIAAKLIIYGPLGIICVVLMGAVYKLYSQLVKLREEHAAQMRSMRNDHIQEQNAMRDVYTKEINDMRERYISKAETWMEKYHDIANSMNQVLDALARKYK